ncbi:MAG TPA: response regulator [Sphaerochaeta sp.]|nr:response regulator [Sphaerochaeta sp.]
MYKLLIADDEHLECDAIELLVNRAKLPLQCIKAKNGHEAVALAKLHNPEIAFLDIRMPGLDGIEAAKQIRTMDEACLIVFLTAWSTFELAQQAIRLGASEYLVKPVQRKDVYDLLDKLIAALDEQRLSEKQQAGEIKEVLNLFSREFFASLKFGRLSVDAMQSYFLMQGITNTEGFALVINGMNEEALRSFFQSSRLYPKLQICYFPSVDRITVLIFTSQGAKIIEQFAGHQADESMVIGSGVLFSNLEEIPKSISAASIAHTYAYRHKIRFQRFNDVLKEQKDYSKLQEKNLLMIEQTLAGNVEKARTLAHEIIDTVHTTNTLQEDAIEELYELLIMFSYELNKEIAFLSYPKPQKDTIMGQEIYLMDFIDLACEAIQEDKRDRYSRPFKYIDQYLHSNYHEQISVEQAAKITGLNTKYFSHLCKTYFGASFVEYLTSIRMEKAKALLATGQYSIKEVAEMTSFSDGNYFSRVFRQTFGISPSSFREEGEEEKKSK